MKRSCYNAYTLVYKLDFDDLSYGMLPYIVPCHQINVNLKFGLYH